MITVEYLTRQTINFQKINQAKKPEINHLHIQAVNIVKKGNEKQGSSNGLTVEKQQPQQ